MNMDSNQASPEERKQPEARAEETAPQQIETPENQEEIAQPTEEVPVKEPLAEALNSPDPVLEIPDKEPAETREADPAAPAPHDDESVHLEVIAEHHEELEAEPLENFGHMPKEELVLRMEAFSKEQDVNSVKNRVQAARDAFQAIFNQEKDVAYAAFLEAGGIKEEFDYKDSLEEKFFEAYKHFQKRRSEFILGQEKIRTENLRLKHEILQQMKNILQKEEDMSKAFNEFHDLQAKWRGIGPVPPQNVNDLWMTYKLYSDRFYEFIRLNRELQDLEMKKNLEMKMHLCERAEEMLLEPSLNKALQEIQALQHKWREIGAVPREKRTEIWLRFKAAVDKIYENKRSYLDSQKKVFEDNFAAKNALIVKAGEIVKGAFAKHQQWQEGLKQLLELQTEWRKIGPAGKEHNDSVWHTFKSTCDQFFKNKDEFYKQKKQEYAANLQKKTELCMQAESLKESSDWKSTANELIRLQQEWKKVGPAGDRNEKIWQRFKVACDAFFNRKSAHFADQDQSQAGNLEQKNALITEVEQFALPADPNEALEQLKAFQRKFTEIGLVPLKQKDDIQQRFRSAIQVHFDALKAKPEYRQSYRQRGDRPERAERGERPERSYRPAAESTGNEEQRNLASKVSKLTGEVQLWENNLGFFANSKNASALKQEYESKIQQAKDEISKLKARLQELKSAS
ncbi:MAG: DUF349 domain-containing protein [Bacteroidia bacterium]|nr:DUF349 domain-containing protein [Bacteroidia bacterium]